jgi:hypothetical protein
LESSRTSTQERQQQLSECFFTLEASRGLVKSTMVIQ